MSQAPDQEYAARLAFKRDVHQTLEETQRKLRELYDAEINRVGQKLGMQEAQQKTLTWDPSKIPWVQESGSKGPYERYPAKDQKAEATDDYKNMLQDLKEHNGAMHREGYFYWVFPDQATVGRRKKSA